MDGTMALASAGAALATSFGANSWLARVARRRGWCDRPEARSEKREARGEGLKIHTRPIPFVGGLGIATALAVAAGVSALVGHGVAWGVLVAGALALVPGVWDDFKWKAVSVPVSKLGLQLAMALLAAGVLWVSGIRVVPGLPLLGLGLAAAYWLGGVNALNLEDGLDGLAGGEAAVSALGFAVILNLRARPDAALLAVLLAGALVGFLLLNWHPARLFLGDGGSHQAGALLACLAVTFVSGRGLGAVPATVFVIGLPVLDTLWVMARRLVSGKGLMAGDRNHLYDILHRRGLSVRQTVGVSWAIQAALVAAGVVWALRG
jgi:UDP-GlcNAc:undecaprenyl-phosphate GlcNAc-1-phosphate transferase